MEEKQTKRPSFKTILIIILVIMGGAYLFMRNDCIKDINFKPENETPVGRGNTVTEGARYEFWPEISLGRPSVFQTRKEAISYCMSKKI